MQDVSRNPRVEGMAEAAFFDIDGNARGGRLQGGAVYLLTTDKEGGLALMSEGVVFVSGSEHADQRLTARDERNIAAQVLAGLGQVGGRNR